MSNKYSLKINSIYNVLYKALNVLFPLLTATYVARVLSADGVGRVAYAQNVVKYFSTIAALGITTYGIREIAKVHKSRQDSSKVMSELLWINGTSTFICVILYYGLIFIVPSFRADIFLYSAVGLTIIFNFFNVDWFYQGFEQYRYIAIRSFFVKLISLVLIFLFVKERSDYVIYALISCLGIGGNNLYNIVHLRKFHVKFLHKNLELHKHLKPIFILLCSAIAVELYTLLDTTMLGALCTSEAVGYYTNSMRLVKILITVITAIGAVLLPRLSYYKSIGNQEACSEIVSRVFSILMFLFIPCEIGLILVSGQVIPILFGNSFIPAIPTLRIGSLLICVLGFSNLFGTQVLLTYGQERLLLYTTVAGALSNIVLNAILIPLFQQNGAAIASVISEAVVTTLSVIYSRKYIKVKVSHKFLLTTIFSSVVMACVVFGIEFTKFTLLPKLILAVALGVISYVACNCFMKNPIMNEFKSFYGNKKWREQNETIQ